jgi:hypothetical protein
MGSCCSKASANKDVPAPFDVVTGVNPIHPVGPKVATETQTTSELEKSPTTEPERPKLHTPELESPKGSPQSGEEWSVLE